MGKITSTIVNNSWQSVNGVINNLRTMIRSEVKEKGKYIIPKDDEMISPTICYNGGKKPKYASNVYSCIKSLDWSEEYNDVIIYCENGAQYLSDCCIDDIFCLAETLAYFNEYGYHEDNNK